MDQLASKSSFSAVQYYSYSSLNEFLYYSYYNRTQEGYASFGSSYSGGMIFLRVRQALLGVSFLLAAGTLSMIVGHRSLRRQHHVFPFNIVFADLLGIVTLFITDVTSEIGVIFTVYQK